MERTLTEIREDEKGFTLVELAIVMIIIGLLITGILKGQEMIANAQVTSTVSQIKGIEAATSTFRDSFGAFPGDMSNASTRLNNCAADPCNDGGGNGRIDITVGNAAGLGDEGAYFFNHLRAADLISGLDGSNDLAFGAALLGSPVGGGYFIGHTATGAPVQFTAGELRTGHYLTLNGLTSPVADNSGILTPTQAARIDRKLDDGAPDTGTVVGQATANNCRVAAGDSVYDEISQGSVCAIAIRIQN